MKVFGVLLCAILAVSFTAGQRCIIPVCDNSTFSAMPLIIDPICAIRIQYKTFDNFCLLEGPGCKDGYRYVREGDCSIPQNGAVRATDNTPCAVPVCSENEDCPRILQPVCAVKVELKTFDNQWELMGLGCQEGFKFFKGGRCDTPDEVQMFPIQ